MRRALPLLLLLAAVSGCKQIPVFGPKDAHREIWLDDRLDPETVDPHSLRALEDRIELGGMPEVRFEFDSDEVPYEFYQSLDAVADWMLRHPDRKLRLDGRACVIGGVDYNIDLSRRRARAIKAYLVSRGVPPPSIRFVALGKTQPLVANDTVDHRRLNRSVVLHLVDRDWNSVY